MRTLGFVILTVLLMSSIGLARLPEVGDQVSITMPPITISSDYRENYLETAHEIYMGNITNITDSWICLNMSGYVMEYTIGGSDVDGTEKHDQAEMCLERNSIEAIYFRT
jgi:hypothetical protein